MLSGPGGAPAVTAPETREPSSTALEQRRILVVLVTAHPGVDHEAVARNASHLLDLRGVTRRLELDTVEQL